MSSKREISPESQISKPQKYGSGDDKPKRRKTSQKQAKEKLPPQKATVISLAEQQLSSLASNITDKNSEIIQRIKKCLHRANHPNASEFESKTSFAFATRLMSQYNVSTADLMDNEEQKNHAQLAGSSVVSITSNKGEDHRAVLEAFTNSLVHAMEVFFNCKSYSTQSPFKIKWTFYGIAENTVLAAEAFERCYNRISHWALGQTGRASKTSYCRGVADGLRRLAEKEKQRETEMAKKAESDGPRAGAFEGGESDIGSNDSDGMVDPDDSDNSEMDVSARATFKQEDIERADQTNDIDEAINTILKKEEATGELKSSQFKDMFKSAWKSEMKLVRFRQNADAVADDFLKQNDINLSACRAQNRTITDLGAYYQGKKDSEKIDVRQKNLE